MPDSDALGDRVGPLPKNLRPEVLRLATNLRVLEALGSSFVCVLRVLEALGGSFVRVLRVLEALTPPKLEFWRPGGRNPRYIHHF